MDTAILKARKEALEELSELLSMDDYDIAERAIDKYIDYLELMI